MAELTIKQKKELAEFIYTQNNLTQKEVAARVFVSENTLGKWVKAGNWDAIKTSITITRQEQLARLYNQVAALNKVIAERKEAPYASSKEADTLNKLAAAIDKMERDTGLADIVDVTKRFLDWMRKFDINRAKEFSGLFDAFIKDNLK